NSRSLLFLSSAHSSNSTLSLHDALPISDDAHRGGVPAAGAGGGRKRLREEDQCGRRTGARDPHRRQGRGVPLPECRPAAARGLQDRKSTRLNSSHVKISYAVFCLKKKKK